MNNRITFITVSTLCLVAVAGLSSLFAKDSGSAAWKALEQSYAQANLELAQARLALAKNQNEESSGTVSQEMIDELEAGVQITENQLKHLDSASAANPFAPQIIAAQDDLKRLEADLNESLAANKLQAGAVSELAIGREQAEINVAKARIAALNALAEQPAEVRIQWQIGQLQDQIRALWARPLIED
jgi:hypothetical protein